MTVTINGTTGITTPAVNGYTPVNKAGDTMTGNLSITRADANMARLTLANTSRNWSISNYGTEFTPNGNLAIADETAAAIRFAIDANGCITKPAQPFFIVQRNGAYSHTSNDKFEANQIVQSNSGMTWDTTNHRVTIPVSGVYLVTFAIRFEVTTLNYIYLKVFANDASVISDQLALGKPNSGDSFQTHNGSLMIKLVQNDVVDFRVAMSPTSPATLTSGQSWAGMMLIG